MALIGGQTYTVIVTPSGVSPVDITLYRLEVSRTLSTTQYICIDVTSESVIRLIGGRPPPWSMMQTISSMQTPQ